MNATQLVIGERYILKSPNCTATYEGKHEGKLALAGGATYYGGGNFLRFRYTDADGEHVILLNNGADVVESEGAKTKRQREEHERRDRLTKAYLGAVEFMHDLGFAVEESKWDAQKLGGDTVAIDKPDTWSTSGAQEIDGVEIEGLTVGHLKSIIRAVNRSPRIGSQVGER